MDSLHSEHFTSVCSDEVLTLCIALMTTGKQVVLCCLALAEHTEHMAFGNFFFWKCLILEIKHLLQMGSDMLGHAASLDCPGLWDEVKISSSAPAISLYCKKKPLQW